MIAWLTTTLRHLTVAWLAASSLYFVGVERLPTAWLTVALSTYLGLAVGLFDHVSGRQERRLVAVQEVAAPPPAPASPAAVPPPAKMPRERCRPAPKAVHFA